MAYTRVNWEDRPSTNTPINATNLNKMDKGIYDATYENGLNVSNEVDEDYRVSFLKSKNLNDGINRGCWIGGNATTYGVTSNDTGIYIPVSGGNYTISTTISQARYRVCCGNDIPSASSTAYNGLNKDNTNETITINTTGYKYLIINVTDLNAMKITKGNTATTEDYFSPSIYVDGEEIYSKPEVLWQNPSPSSDMANNASINLSTDDYNSYEVLWVMSTSDTSNVFSSGIIPKGKSTILNTARCASGGTTNYERPINYNSDTLLKSGIPYSATASARSATASVLIPYMILGWK